MTAQQITGSGVIAVVKANCYSNGLAICNMIEDCVCGFAVASVTEGVCLRRRGITKPILALSFDKTEAQLCRDFDIAASISSARNYVKGVGYHIAIDSGMNRGGVKGSRHLLQLLDVMSPRDICGVYTHIYSKNDMLTSAQIGRFCGAVQMVKRCNQQAKTHIFASNYVQNHTHFKADFVRLGMGLYQGAVAVTSNILQTKWVRRGEPIGYDGEFVAQKDTKIALCEGGYFDGILRQLSGQKIWINTDFCKVIGKISMDSHIVDITDVAADIGDKTVIIDDDCLSFDARAETLKTSSYELMVGMRGRYKYVYFN